MEKKRRAILRSVIVISLLVSATSLLLGAGKRGLDKFQFDENFLWGAATASHQVEGGNTNNDYYEWELQGKVPPAGRACEHWTRYEQDFDIAKSLNLNAYRMSIEWSRIEPRHGEFSREALDHYKSMLASARSKGLKTFVTLHHFTNPIWVAHLGGWANPEMPRWFADYAAYVVPNLGELVDFWMTVNEPNVNALTSYVVGATPPGEKSIEKAPIALSNFLKAHAAAYHLIHSFFPDAKVGFAHHVRVFTAKRWWHPGDQLVAKFIDRFWNLQLLRSIKTGTIHLSVPFVFNYTEAWPELEGTLDFIGLNYYTRDIVKLALGAPQKFIIVPNDKAPKSDMGWEIYPHGLYRLLKRMSKYGVPVYVTENGLADSEDQQRSEYLCSHLEATAQAIRDGANVKGYLHWSLLDNYEWIDGYKPRFGLVEVNYETQERKVRASALLYARIAASRSLDACLRKE